MRLPAAQQLTALGLGEQTAQRLTQQIREDNLPPNNGEAWRIVSRLIHGQPFKVHHLYYQQIFADWDRSSDPPPAWIPSEQDIQGANVTLLMTELGLNTYEKLHEWSIRNPQLYWEHVITSLGVRMVDLSTIMDASRGVEQPIWLKGAKLNIVESCFQAPGDSPAIIYGGKGSGLKTVTVAELHSLANRVSNGLIANGLQFGDAIAIDMPMTVEAVAIYLGIIQTGCVVISIADSFAPKEIATRLRIGNAKAIFTQACIVRGEKTLPLFEKVLQADPPRAIVIPVEKVKSPPLRKDDLSWHEFLSSNDQFEAVICSPDHFINILFSSGTTGEPKAIPWTHTTPIKCAADAHFHQDVHAGDILAWPTNLGWMMGPWLILSALINRATIALYYDAPNDKDFGLFVQNAGVTMLGVVPSMVKTWRVNDCMFGLDWSAIKVFSSTGEVSNADDMLYCMSIANYRPVIEYCGGTEIGGGYLTGVIVKAASPATFNSLALGINGVIRDENGHASSNGEMFLVPPSIGLSCILLNKDHHSIYFADTPVGKDLLRRHGDQVELLPGGYYRIHGRMDDTMNLGGIKVGNAEIERVILSLPGVLETAAIAVSQKDGGPNQLVIYIVSNFLQKFSRELLISLIQELIKNELNPFFRVHDVVLVGELPRTASNKVMRRTLRNQYFQA